MARSRTETRGGEQTVSGKPAQRGVRPAVSRGGVNLEGDTKGEGDSNGDGLHINSNSEVQPRMNGHESSRALLSAALQKTLCLGFVFVGVHSWFKEKSQVLFRIQ